MKIKVKVKPNSKKQDIKDLGNNKYIVYVTSLPVKNKANVELINLLSKYLGIPAKQIKIKTGHSSQNKILQVC